MNPPIIDVLRNQRNDALDALANAVAEIATLRIELEKMKQEKDSEKEKEDGK
jgi:hypothetical protein